MKCQSKCALDKTETFCIGCGRSIVEIKAAFERLVDLRSRKGYIKA